MLIKNAGFNRLIILFIICFFIVISICFSTESLEQSTQEEELNGTELLELANELLKDDNIVAQDKKYSAQEIYAIASLSVVKLLIKNDYQDVIGSGTAFSICYGEKILFVTNSHILEEAVSLEIITDKNESYPVFCVYSEDKENDLALLVAPGYTEKDLTLSDMIPSVGDKVFTISNPKGLTNTLSEGLVSAIRKENNIPKWIQTTAPISPGSSGGPLLGENGTVLGVLTFVVVDGQNLNFARPSQYLNKLLVNPNYHYLWRKKGIWEQYRHEQKNLLEELTEYNSEKVGPLMKALNSNKWGEFQYLLNSLANENKTNATFWYFYGLYLNSQSNWQEAVLTFNKAIGYCQDKNNQVIVALLHYEMAKIEFEVNHNWENAEKEILSVIYIYPSFAPAYNLLYEMTASTDFDDILILVGKKLVEIVPESGEAHALLGQAYRKNKNYLDALIELNLALKKDPRHRIAYYNLGMVYGNLEQWENALESFKCALEYDDSDSKNSDFVKEVNDRINVIKSILIEQ